MGIEQKLVYFLLGYFINPATERGVNICVVLFDPIATKAGFCKAQFGPRWKEKVSDLDPEADLEMLDALVREIESSLSIPDAGENMLELMESSFSNALRVSDRTECRAEDPLLELERLASLYL